MSSHATGTASILPKLSPPSSPVRVNAAEVKQPSFDTLLLAIKNSSANLNANINSTHAEIQATRTDLITSSIHDT